MNELLAVATITILAVISPGGDFAMVTRNSLLHGRRAGVITALGIALGNWVHIAYTLMGVAVLIQAAPQALLWVKWCGALYLIYIGIQTFKTPATPTLKSNLKAYNMSDGQAAKMGFFTNALNPKTTLFVVSLFSQVVATHTTISQQLIYGVFISFAHGVWFAAVALLFSNQRLVTTALGKQIIVNRMIGGILVALGFSLAFSAL